MLASKVFDTASNRTGHQVFVPFRNIGHWVTLLV
jgi:hypothetical protein